MTGRRYESGVLVDDKRAKTPALGWGKNDAKEKSDDGGDVAAHLPAEPERDREIPVAPEKPAAKVMRRPPPVIAAPAPVVTTPPVIPTALPPAAPPLQPPGDQGIIIDTSDMRQFLLKQMVRAANGEITSETVKNIVTLSQQVYNATKLELDAARILKDKERSIRALELVAPQNRDG